MSKKLTAPSRLQSAVMGQQSGWAAAACSRDFADLNADDRVDFYDIDPFVACLFGDCP